MATDLLPGKRRVFANAGVGGMRSGRWADVADDDPRVDGWIRAGLVSERGNRGEEPPDRLPRGCCGARR